MFKGYEGKVFCYPLLHICICANVGSILRVTSTTDPVVLCVLCPFVLMFVLFNHRIELYQI